MAVQTEAAAAGRSWYARTPEEVAAAAGVDPGVGLSAAQAADLKAKNGPNSLPEEKPKPGWRRFLDEYRSYMQIILVAAAVVSLLIKEWSTAVLLILLTVLNAVVGMRQEGKAESAMNALKSMMKATARVRRDGTEAQIPAKNGYLGVLPGHAPLLSELGTGVLSFVAGGRTESFNISGGYVEVRDDHVRVLADRVE